MLAIDLCAGIGWSVATRSLGISELGIEIMPEAIATRDAMGCVTQDVSIADLPDSFCTQAPLQIAGPPCQTFSPAGNGEGRRALGEVLHRVAVFGSTGVLVRGGSGDPRTWLVLEPLRLAVHGMPTFIVWEQVSPVLPVWEACAVVLRSAGYSVWTGNLYSEQYGVPQTRKRAFLIARLDGKVAAPPVPTHSRYHNRTPDKMDPGVLPWVSMAQALGWGTTGRPSFTVTGGGSATGGAEPFGHAARESLLAYRSSAMPNATVRDQDRPAPTVMFGRAHDDVHWVYRNGTHEHAAERPIDTPAPTVMLGARSNTVTWVQRSNYSSSGERSVPSPVKGSPNLGARQLNEPSSTVTSKGFKWASPAESIRVTVEEAAILQTFPHPDLIQGGSGKRYLQVGNMVPPVLGAAILRTFLS